MPRARARRNTGQSKKGTGTPKSEQARHRRDNGGNSGGTGGPTQQRRTVLIPALTALVCFCGGFYYALFSTDPNRAVIGGIAVLTGFIWLFLVWSRVRRLPRRIHRR
ncbi:hypothetical protein EI42_00962 [Thermosporothrix hazakensis]|uniref:Uncharacterized protein n=1 Tax=Thermosporothrix hazakensis TaxID=644383 RepID=A0A326USC5_THEHA|nr:DUF2776 domain-containing protein [Thermosporothrix hazakensis]PZW36779.1 hypothetical protein EI42_00962 [Thermosporothrix hazakensis]